jgi:hypothetical protein
VNETLKKVVEYLKSLASDGDMASVQINTNGKVILRVGIQKGNSMSLEEFATRIKEG